MIFFRERSTAAELMDDPGSDKKLLFRTFDQFEPINRLLGRSRYFIERMLLPNMERQGSRLLTVVDIGAGGGDFALLLARSLERRGRTANIVCIDNDPRAVEYARERCRSRKNITVVRGSAFDIGKLPNRPDYLFANHLLHHLPDDACAELLRIVHAEVACGYLLTDLERGTLWYCLYALTAAVLFRNSFALPDGLLSIRKGFRTAELVRIIGRAGLSPAPRVRRLLPGRLVIDNLM
jgi:2-polyprenyl-3-methyl-5-hydroxy-6-metoxy-1,4-benzoquinol methylase